MRLLRGFTACAVAAALAGCVIQPDLLEQNSAGAPPTAANRILVVVDSRLFGNPPYGTEGRAYMSGLGSGLQHALADVPSKVVEVDAMAFTNPVPPALQALQPSHAIRVHTVSDLRRADVPIHATWQMDVSSVTTAAIPATEGKPAGTRFTLKPIYKARAEGDTCLDSDGLAYQCGEAMGKLLGDTLRAAHVMQFGAGA